LLACLLACLLSSLRALKWESENAGSKQPDPENRTGVVDVTDVCIKKIPL
jgi:hypothetical protein